LRILLDGYWLGSGPPSGHGLVRAIVDHWTQEYPNDDVFVLMPKSRASDTIAASGTFTLVTTNLRAHPLINWFGLRSAERRHGPFDLVLAQNFSSSSRQGIVFIHDVLFQSNPEWFGSKERLYFGLMTLLAPFSKSVLTSSVTEKNRIMRHNPRLKRVVATGLGLPRRDVTEEEQDAVTHLRPGNFTLSVGRLNIRKNLTRTIHGAIESGTLSPETPLVIVGEASGLSNERTAEILEAEARGDVVFLGFVPDAQLVWLYVNCRFMIFLSLDEGYGLPPLEALSAGAKVLASDIPVMREVLGDSATYVDPLDVGDISRSIKRLHHAHVSGDKTPAPPGLRSWSSVLAIVRDEASLRG
jgi:glycosyltransferase involved in cell wall biosynthesis